MRYGKGNHAEAPNVGVRQSTVLQTILSIKDGGEGVQR